jgi:hypothetical protein
MLVLQQHFKVYQVDQVEVLDQQQLQLQGVLELQDKVMQVGVITLAHLMLLAAVEVLVQWEVQELDQLQALAVLDLHHQLQVLLLFMQVGVVDQLMLQVLDVD